MKMYETKEWLAGWLSIKPSTVDHLRRRRGLPAIRVGKHYRYIPDEVSRWLKEKRDN